LAVVHEHVRKGNIALDEDDPEAAAEIARLVIAMTDVLGVNPLAPNWVGSESAGGDASEALDALVQAQLDGARRSPGGPRLRDRRCHPRSTCRRRDRDRGHPAGARWSLAKES
jgi:cysteinyl-tRNA synthetase